MSTKTDALLVFGGIGLWTLGLYMSIIGMSPAHVPLTFFGAFMASFGVFNLARTWWKGRR